MRPLLHSILVVLLLAGIIPLPAQSCTTFVIEQDDQLVFGRNLDWFVEDGLIIVNKRDCAKSALIFPPDKPANWVSKYGSVTFNQVGCELPYGGINEKGLVVENMVLRSGKYPEPDNRPVINEVQWIQYILDLYETVPDVIDNLDKVRIGQESTYLHYLLCDRNGDAAAIEFIDGKAHIYAGDDLPIMTLTNSRYKNSLDFVKANDTTRNDFSLYRFKTAADMAGSYDKSKNESIVDYSFDILSKVCFEKNLQYNTKWSIVYDLASMTVYFKTMSYDAIKSFNLKSFDFTCNDKRLVFDIGSDQSGDVSQDFKTYSTDANLSLIMSAFERFRTQGFLDMPDSLLIMISEYPNSTRCDK